MPKPRSKSKKQKLVRPETNQEIQSPNDLEEYVREASEVKQLTQTAGWAILERDLTLYKKGIAKRLAYINPKRPEFKEAQVLYQAADKIIGMVNDYQENRDIAIETLNKMENPDLAITLDIDNEL